MSKRENAQQVVEKHVLWSVAAGLVPLPIVDFVTVGLIQHDMLKQIASAYELSFSETQGNYWVSMLTGTLLARVGASALKMIPGIGSVLGGVAGSVTAGASTYAIGQVAINHFDVGGTFANLDMDAARRAYEQELERGKQVAKDLSDEKKEPLDKLERLGQLRDKGVITAQEFEEQKKRVLASL